MSITAATLNRLAALRLSPEAMQEVLSIIASCIEPLEERRRRDRDRKKSGKSKGKSEENPQNFRGISQDIPAEIPPVHISTPLKEESSKAKKPSRSVAIDVPEDPTQSAINFAVSHGWDTAKTRSEWNRWRDWSLNKGRKHRNLDAAWRNWVTSPFQVNGCANGQSNGNRTSQGSGSTGQDATLAGLGRIADRIRERGDAERREREVADGDDAARGNVTRIF